MVSYRQAYESFDIGVETKFLNGSLENGLNACVECCDRHMGSHLPALFWEGQDGRSLTYTFEQLSALSAKFAHSLVELGVKPGDRVAGLLPRIPELLITILGTWRAGAVYQPLFTAFGSKAIEHRINESGAKIIVTDANNRPKLADVSHSARIVTVSAIDGGSTEAGDIDFRTDLERQPSVFEPILRSGNDPFLMMFTSGTTGTAKALEVPLRAIMAFTGYMRHAIDLTPEDNFWNIADPGWAYGLYYAVTGPLALGHSTLFYEGGFNVESLVRVIQKYDVTNLAGSPTAFRLVIAAGADTVAPIKGQLRVVSSAGEPLNPEVIRWFAEHLDTVIHDHYGQTELGMVLCNHHALTHTVHEGSAGFAVPGHRVVIVDEEDQEQPSGIPGNLAVDRTQSPLLWFTGYRHRDTPSLGDVYYITGDTAELNEDGSISFVGRSDDVITSSGYRIGPFEVESALIEHPAVMEAAVIGKPDPERTEIVKAFVVLHAAEFPTDELVEALKQHVRRRMSTHSYPREIEFIDALPKTPSGKIQRFILRNQEIAKMTT
ncbi:AMP-binding protein [Phyllobacterium myrsinacearum]|uniref:Acetyl-CoA synthetase n=1 Tax=Phyllobacterium myrsinacearum TaxID=28101 RepID=A0A839ERN1_9HYPH|nr:AMP-binding protein [Phyllobacterium myrsinacearum]MBA8879097.1 acetyl-CoA synthetase [Phyllobacterium myrsinacearum]